MARTPVVTTLTNLQRNSTAKLRILPEHITDHAEALAQAVEALADIAVDHAMLGTGVLLSYANTGGVITLTGAGITKAGALVWGLNASVDMTGLANGTYYLVMRANPRTADRTFTDPETGESITHTLAVGSGVAYAVLSPTDNDAVLAMVTKSGTTYTITPYRPRLRPSRIVQAARNDDAVIVNGANVYVVGIGGSPGILGAVRVIGRAVVTATAGAAGWLEVALRAYTGMGTPQVIGIARGYSSGASSGANISVQGVVSLTPNPNEALTLEVVASWDGTTTWTIPATYASLVMEVEAEI